MVGLALRTTKQCYPTIILGFGVVYCPKYYSQSSRFGTDLTQILRIYETWDLGVVEG